MKHSIWTTIKAWFGLRDKPPATPKQPSLASQQAANLSDYAVSRLIGRNRFNPIYRARQEFVSYIDSMDEVAGHPVYENWEAAWEVFKNLRTSTDSPQTLTKM
jgi:hypothetical protein